MSIFFTFLKYAMFPGLKNRINDLFMSGFQYVPYFIALVYQAVRLLPPNHPYLNPKNFGRYGVRHVIGEAANNLVVSRRNIDQVILFFSILIGMAMLTVQMCLLGVSAIFQPVFASGFGTMFLTPASTQATDIASMMLDMVFGVPGVFNSCVSTAALCTDLEGNPIAAGIPGVSSPLADNAASFFPFALHQGLHQMFQLYSMGLLVVGFFILCYFIVTILLETAESGTPFGKRFNKVWAPLRLVAAFGLLIPVGYGLNSAQYIVLYAAKFGSGFATNGWNLFNETLTGSYLGDVQNLISRPNIPELNTLLQFMYVSRTCYEGELASRKVEMKPFLVKGPIGPNPQQEITTGTTYAELTKFANGSNVVTISFGELGDGKKVGNDQHPNYGLYKGFVKPICGQIKLNLSDARMPGQTPSPEPGPSTMQQYYFQMIKDLWFKKAGTESINEPNYPKNLVEKYGSWPNNPNATEPDATFRAKLEDYYTKLTSQAIDTAIENQVNSGTWAVPTALRQTGWAGAGIWYNRVAEMNGAVTTAVFNIPAPSMYPDVMEHVSKTKRQNDKETNINDIFDPKMADGKPVKYERPQDETLAPIYNKAFMYWQIDGNATSTRSERTGNVLIDAINLLLGTDGLFSMRRNVDVHPLAQLVGIGRSLVESTIRNMAGAGLATVLQPIVGSVAGTFAGFFITIAMIGLTVGFVLFYIVPFLPFIYFFFAIGGWFKGIFEALLGAPLWALAHLRIDGDGFAGEAASQGYYLIFEIFLRPILIVFGLLASISIFAALVSVLNNVFDLAISNLTGFDESCEQTNCGPTSLEYYRGPIDQFFFTIVYAVLVYIMGLSSFKLIDQIPSNILRWIGSSAQTFNEKEDGAEGLVGTATIGAQQTLGSLGGGLRSIVGIGGKGG